jgi:hypothetical protein
VADDSGVMVLEMGAEAGDGGGGDLDLEGWLGGHGCRALTGFVGGLGGVEEGL